MSLRLRRVPDVVVPPDLNPASGILQLPSGKPKIKFPSFLSIIISFTH